MGLGTFVDPRIEGGKLNSKSTEDLVKLVEFAGEEWLFYPSPKIDVAIIRGTVADENGNITLDKEGMLLEQINIAHAAKACGGIVIVQVERIVKAGTLHPKAVKIPGVSVDYVVLSQPENHMQNLATQFNPAAVRRRARTPQFAGTYGAGRTQGDRRRTAMELKPGAITNLGIGIPAGVPSVAAEEGVSDQLTLSVESGISGGIPAQGGDFGVAYNADAIIEQSLQFDFYDGGGLDASFLGLAQATTGAM